MNPVHSTCLVAKMYDRVVEWTEFTGKWEVLFYWLRTMFEFTKRIELTEVPEIVHVEVKEFSWSAKNREAE